MFLLHTIGCTRRTTFQQTEYVLDSSPGVEKIKMKIKISFKIDA